ncbi:hypothetical protein ACI7BZ_14525 [Xanthobacter sp. AM11]|uniref:hypothetical protein n=1 Tax=Xanthobacter sp. AM11 TaxID=3380643 RepID=UPI0039BF8A8C
MHKEPPHTSLKRKEGRRSPIIARLLASLVAVAAGIWLTTTEPISTAIALIDLEQVATSLMDGETFDASTLENVGQQASRQLEGATCNPRAFQDLAIIELGRLRFAFDANNADEADRLLSSAEMFARKGVTCNPNSSVSWAVLAVVEFLRNDNTTRFNALMNMSFQTGPLASWAFQQRVDLLLSLYPNIDQPARMQLLRQLNWLIDAGFPSTVANYYIAGNDEQRAFLRDIIATKPDRDQKSIAEHIRNEGGDINLPRVPPRGRRPWD